MPPYCNTLPVSFRPCLDPSNSAASPPATAPPPRPPKLIWPSMLFNPLSRCALGWDWPPPKNWSSRVLRINHRCCDSMSWSRTEVTECEREKSLPRPSDTSRIRIRVWWAYKRSNLGLSAVRRVRAASKKRAAGISSHGPLTMTDFWERFVGN